MREWQLNAREHVMVRAEKEKGLGLAMLGFTSLIVVHVFFR